MSDDPFDLNRFVAAQDGGVFDRALMEIRKGSKQTHWMWFIFPQIAGLGSSPTARAYAISGREEAAAYLAHPVLGPRLIECAEAAVNVPVRTANEIFGSPDDLKLRSCATLFARAASTSVFDRLLTRFFDGQPDDSTLHLLDEAITVGRGLNTLAIIGSARGAGHTRGLLDLVLDGRIATQLDLCDLHIREYEYGGAFDGDDFEAVVEAMIGHEAIVFATPVYWYAMSGRMKTLFDRFTDIVTVRKDLGRRLAGRSIFALACGSEPELPPGFEVPFSSTAAYLDMHYGGTFYAQTATDLEFSSDVRVAAVAFGDRLFGR